MAGRKTFTAGEVLQAADVNDYLMDQSVMVFAGTAARGSAIPSPTEGMVTYRSDDDVVEVFDGSVYKPVGPGQILQVVSTAKTDTFSAVVASGTFSAVTGLTASITPSSASSKVLVQVEIAMGTDSGLDRAQYFQISRGGTLVGVGDASGNRARVSGGSSSNNAQSLRTMTNTSMTFLDSPASTGSLTYSVAVGSEVGAGTPTVYVNRGNLDDNQTYTPRGISTITLMEVAG